ncbi:MAG TPA: DUF2339 domain-containing protein [Thermoleophilaceae bacterium]|jgi:uncharacterized membrane protein
MDVLELVRGHGRRLDAVEREMAGMSERLARLEGVPAERPQAERPPRPAPAGAERPAPRSTRPEGSVREWLDPSTWNVPPTAPPAAGQAPPPTGPPQQPARPAARPSQRPGGMPARPAAGPTRPAQPAAPRIDLEELLGGRILGLAGALAVLLGVAFLVAMAVDRGWVDEPTRIAIGFGGCSALLLGAVALYERRGRTQAALAAAGAAVAGLFATLTAGAQLYELYPVPVSLAIAAAIGGAATALALRWNARTFAALGLVGALLAPVLVGADQSGLTIAFVLFVLTIAVAVADRRGWSEWLPLTASIVAAPQILDWLVDGPDAVPTVLVLSCFWAANAVAAASLERTRGGSTMHPIAVILLGGASALVAPTGFAALDELGLHDQAVAWLGALGAAHAGLGLAAIGTRRASRDLAHLSIAIGIGLADVTFALAVEGFALAIGWAASAAALTALARVRHAAAGSPAADAGNGGDAKRDPAAGETVRLAAGDTARLTVAAAVQIGLALAHALTLDADPTQLSGRPEDMLAGVAALVACGLAALVSARLLARDPLVRHGGHAIAIATLAYLSAFVIDGQFLAVAWAVEAVAVMALARRARTGVDPVGSISSGALVGLALTHAITIDAQPGELAGPPHELLAGVASLGAVGLAALLAAQLLPRTGPGRAAGHAVTLLVLAYLSAFVIDGPLLAAAWAVEAVAILALARHRDGGIDAVGSIGAVSLLAFALLHGLVLEAAPRALVYGVEDLLDAAIALATLAAAALAMARLIPEERRDERLGFVSLAAAALVYLGSVAIVTAFQPTTEGFDTAVGLLDERQQGQLLLSAFWALAGLGALIAGLARRQRAIRVGGFVLLGIATAKVFMFDLSTLDSLYRVGSFVALGLLLLGAAFAWQRTRALRDGAGAPNGGEAGA